MKFLTKFICFYNMLTSIKNFGNLIAIRKININKNCLKDLDNMKLPTLQELTCSENTFEGLNWLTGSSFNNL